MTDLISLLSVTKQYRHVGAQIVYDKLLRANDEMTFGGIVAMVFIVYKHFYDQVDI